MAKIRRMLSFALPVALLLAGPAVAADTTVINNSALRFGNGTEASLTADGLLKQPFYYSASAETFRKLTFNTYPLDLAVGYGSGNPGQWNRNTVYDITTASPSGLVTDFTGLTLTGGGINGGWGVVTSQADYSLGGSAVRLNHNYSLGQSDDFIRIETRITNSSASTLPDTSIWVGTRDDWVGTSDGPVKTRGNIDSNGFTAITSSSQPANSIQITSGSEGVLFYSVTPSAVSVVDTCCSFSNVYTQDPATAPTVTPAQDGSYGMYLPVGDLAAGASATIVWFYAAGAIQDLTAVTQQVAAAGAAEQGLSSVSVSGGVLDYQFNYSGTGYWMVVPRGSTAPTGSEVVAGTDYGSVIIDAAGNGPIVANTERTFEISGLAEATQYSVYAVTKYEDPENAGSFLTSTPEPIDFSTLSDAPTINSITPADAEVSVDLSVSSNETNFQYSIDDGVSWVSRSPASTSSPWVISGLTNGQTYNFRFRGIFDGQGGVATSATAIVPNDVGVAQLGLTSTAVDGGNISLEFNYDATSYWVVVSRSDTAPDSAEVVGGIDYGAVTVIDSGSQSVLANAEESIEVSGLVEGIEYTLYTTSVYDDPSNPGTDINSAVQSFNFSTITAAPAIVSLTSGDQQVSVELNASSNETNFEYSVDGGSNWVARSPSSTSTPWVITSLTNGTSYDFLFRGVFDGQGGLASEAFSVTPAVAPGAPSALSTSFQARIGATVSWAAPSSNGGLAVTGYLVEYNIGSGWQTIEASGTTASIPDVRIDEAWSFRVAAINPNGTGSATTYTHAAPIPAAVTPPEAPPTLVTEDNKSAVVAPPGESVTGTVAGGVVTPTVSTVSRVEADTPENIQTEIGNILTSFNNKRAGGAVAPLSIAPVDTEDGALIYGLLANSDSSTPVGVPAKDVILIETATEAIMISAANGNTPAIVNPEGILVVSQGSTIGVAVHGFSPNTQGELVLLSDPTLLGTFTTDGNGSFIGQASLPPGTPPGNHSAVLMTADLVASIGLSIIQPTSSGSAARPYEGPLNVAIKPGAVCSGGSVIFLGNRLETVEQVEVGGVLTAHRILDDGSLSFNLLGIEPGEHLVRFWVPINSVFLTANISVSDCPGSVTGLRKDAKVNAGSFKGYVAVYAKGYEGSRLSAKVGKDWVIVPSVPAATNDLFRYVEFTGAGVDVAVRIYIDRVLMDTINLTTK